MTQEQDPINNTNPAPEADPGYMGPVNEHQQLVLYEGAGGIALSGAQIEAPIVVNGIIVDESGNGATGTPTAETDPLDSFLSPDLSPEDDETLHKLLRIKEIQDRLYELNQLTKVRITAGPKVEQRQRTGHDVSTFLAKNSQEFVSLLTSQRVQGAAEDVKLTEAGFELIAHGIGRGEYGGIPTVETIDKLRTIVFAQEVSQVIPQTKNEDGTTTIHRDDAIATPRYISKYGTGEPLGGERSEELGIYGTYNKLGVGTKPENSFIGDDKITEVFIKLDPRYWQISSTQREEYEEIKKIHKIAPYTPSPVGYSWEGPLKGKKRKDYLKALEEHEKAHRLTPDQRALCEKIIADDQGHRTWANDPNDPKEGRRDSPNLHTRGKITNEMRINILEAAYADADKRLVIDNKLIEYNESLYR